MFPEGTRVRLEQNPSQTGFVGAEERMINGRPYVDVDFGNGDKRFIAKSRLVAAPTEPDPMRDLASGRFSSADELIRLLNHVRITGSLSDVIYSMESTNTDFHAYQFKPVIKILNSPAKGLLVADEVGLGKTIEAGLVWTELAARHRAGRLLIVCPKSLQEKWRLELLNRFSVRAQIADAGQVLTALQEADQSNEEFALIASYSALRAPRSSDADQGTPIRASVQLANFLDRHDEIEPLIDLLVFDEAHHLRNPDTSQHQLAERLVAIADYKLMLSATPINLGNEDLRSLLRLLEPDIFDREWIFSELQRENEPIVRARDIALDPMHPVSDVLSAIAQIKPGAILRNERRLSILKGQLQDDEEFASPSRRSQIAAQLEEMSLLGGIINRTRRRDVAEIQIKRRATCRTWELSEVEREFYQAASNVIRKYALDNDLSDAFLLANSQRVLASSLAAAFTSWGGGSEDVYADEYDDLDVAAGASRGPLVAALGEVCRDKALGGELRRLDKKYDHLRTALNDTWAARPDEKTIIFSSFRVTIDYLDGRLRDDGVRVFKLHGKIADDRSAVLDAFRGEAGPCVLLASEIGSEGLDLQFCSLLINYDLPWNPMRVEQRIGRIDRIGQTSPSVEIFSLICKGTIEESIYRRLYERLDLIERTIGGFEPILGDIVAELQSRILDPRLSPEEIEQELERAAFSSENRRRHEEEVEEEAAALVAHGDMILNRVREAHDKQKWIAPEELYRYLRDGLTAAFPNSGVDRSGLPGDLYDISLCSRAHEEFRQFLDRDARRHPTLFRRQSVARVSFAPAAGTKGQSPAEYIRINHPLIRFVGQRLQAAHSLANARPVVGGRLASANAPPTVSPGRYGVVVQRWTTLGMAKQDRLVFTGMSLSNDCLLEPSEAEDLLLRSIRHLGLARFSEAECAAIAEKISRRLIGAEMREQYETYVSAEEADHEDRRATRVSVLERKLEQQKLRFEDRIAAWASRQDGKALRIIPAERAKFDKFAVGLGIKIESAKTAAEFQFEPAVTLGILVVDVVDHVEV